MRMSRKHMVWALLAMTAGVMAGSAQQPTNPSVQEAPVKIEGEITSLSLTAIPGPPFLTVKDPDGKEYLVRFGPLRMLRRQGFNPQVGDPITVSGVVCCEMDGKQMIHSNEITLGGKTYSTPMTPERMMRRAPGMRPGPNMPGGAGDCPNCPLSMRHGMHHQMHPPMHD